MKEYAFESRRESREYSQRMRVTMMKRMQSWCRTRERMYRLVMVDN